MLTPQDKTNIVTGCYEAALIRRPDPAGLAAWVAGLADDGSNFAQIFAGIAASGESLAVHDQLHKLLPIADKLVALAAAPPTGVTLAQVQAEIAKAFKAGEAGA